MRRPIDTHRRRLLRHTLGAGAALAVGAPPALLLAQQRYRFEADPFSLGVASGYPDTDSVVLWTRLAPYPQHPLGGLGPADVVPVAFEVAADEAFATIVARGTTFATAEHGFSVHVEPRGLAADRPWWYRFHAGDATSATGRTRTAPKADATPDRLRFAFGSCQHYEQGFFGAWDHVAADAPDLILHLGDYVYESSWGRNLVRRHEGPEPHTLEDYRRRYATYRSDPALQRAHASAPWLVVWDDHEVDNDYAGAISENADQPEWFLARRAAAYQAYYEHMPLRRGMVPHGPWLRLYREVRFGRLARFLMLDDRQYRSPQACPPAGAQGSTSVRVSDCHELGDPARTMLGARQEAWLGARLAAAAPPTWNLLAQQTWFAPLDLAPQADARSVFTDAWDGYPAARDRLLDDLARGATPNPVFLGGDVHSFWFGDVHRDHEDTAGSALASQLVGGSITSQSGFGQAQVDAIAAVNPHVAYADVRRHGYVRVDLYRDRLDAAVRTVDRVDVREPAVETAARFVSLAGRPGLQRA